MGTAIGNAIPTAPANYWPSAKKAVGRVRTWAPEHLSPFARIALIATAVGLGIYLLVRSRD